ncbi:agmatine deiminase family protein [Nesterenkonia sp. MY13]|uniref:Agmatine deiminase family protein n=1 Tax=Nesterenkonia sedimenti TaxID=1463632 RepID=A0A7X8TIU6_9MICC|nr:agmatine deiminase family protein [Nesterenkonia sedimenti]NLS09394.1 agmatine deiminase family protein [Nesterenkonia sedimenti]
MLDPTVQPQGVMPPEWAPHSRTWMAFPPANGTFGQPGSETLQRARQAWAAVANTVIGYEPVSLLVDPADLAVAGELLHPNIEIQEANLDDAWLRDSGPTFVHTAESDGAGVAAVDWVFNGWGAQNWAEWDNDSRLASHIAELTGAPISSSKLVNEGGGIHVDGRGTVLLTETVQLDPGRNPELSSSATGKTEVEAEIHRQLGTTKAIWLPRGLTRDYDEFGTKGHVDIVAAFTGSGALLLHTQQNPDHPDYEVCREIRQALQNSTDAEGNPLRIVEVPAPAVLQDEEGWVDYSYINHYVANGVVVLCAFGDPQDEVAAEILAQEYPDRSIELVEARDIFAFGGGIHCITQQQPAPLH